jgi:hypothetical protein
MACCKEWLRLEAKAVEAKRRTTERQGDAEWIALRGKRDDAEWTALGADVAEAEVRAHIESCEQCKRRYGVWE